MPLVVIKIGSSSLINDASHCVALGNLVRILETVQRLRKLGHQVCIVTSGAVGMGLVKAGLPKKPEGMAAKQALAALGQVHLMRTYTDCMASLGMMCAQILLTVDVMLNRPGLRNTVAELLKMDAVPVFNENDAVAPSHKSKFGDNDTLAAHVAGIIGADILFLLTDVDALYTANPSTNPDARPIREVFDLNVLKVDVSSAGSSWGTGGMATKIKAARIATKQGVTMVISNSQNPEQIESILEGNKDIGTVFHPYAASSMGARERSGSLLQKKKTYAKAGPGINLHVPPRAKPALALAALSAEERRRRAASSPSFLFQSPAGLFKNGVAPLPPCIAAAAAAAFAAAKDAGHVGAPSPLKSQGSLTSAGHPVPIPGIRRRSLGSAMVSSASPGKKKSALGSGSSHDVFSKLDVLKESDGSDITDAAEGLNADLPA